MPPRAAAITVEDALRMVNRHVKYVELDAHGYGALEVNSQGAQMDWFSVTDPDGAQHPAGRARRMPSITG